MTYSLFFGLLTIVVVQRLIELYIAKQNAEWMKARGGLEFGRRHYPVIVMVHILFLLSLILEVLVSGRSLPFWWMMPFMLFIGAQALRVWCLYTLGRYWNTRIIVIPHGLVVRRGPYRLMRHPNYVVVMMEMMTLPLIFQAYLTAFVFSIVDFAVLWFVRIPAEEKALSTVTAYDEEMAGTGRFGPEKI